MGDIANMTSLAGEVNGQRLLLWLRSRAGIETGRALEANGVNEWGLREYHVGRRDLLMEMSDDLAASLEADEESARWCLAPDDGIDLDTLPAPGRLADNTQRGSGV